MSVRRVMYGLGVVLGWVVAIVVAWILAILLIALVGLIIKVVWIAFGAGWDVLPWHDSNYCGEDCTYG